jgi:hypothetical protein
MQALAVYWSNDCVIWPMLPISLGDLLYAYKEQ